MKRSGFITLSKISLGYTLLVILWGAFVRATGAGAGCGSHWPTCNGETLPRAPTTATLIEFTHRITSSLALVLVLAQLVFALLLFPRAHLARRAAGWSVFLMLTEAAIGAGIVLYEKVAHDTSIARGWWMSGHLINTFLLLGAMTLVVAAASREDGGRVSPPGRSGLMLGTAFVAVLLTGVTGAIAALGDTLFPSSSFAEGVTMDRAPEAHLFLQLRALHPFVAAITAVHMLVVASALARSAKDPRTRVSAQVLGGLVVLQVIAGLVNLLLAAPTALQLVHLLIADAVWIALVLLTSSVASEAGAEAAASSRRSQRGARVDAGEPASP